MEPAARGGLHVGERRGGAVGRRVPSVCCCATAMVRQGSLWLVALLAALVDGEAQKFIRVRETADQRPTAF